MSSVFGQTYNISLNAFQLWCPYLHFFFRIFSFTLISVLWFVVSFFSLYSYIIKSFSFHVVLSKVEVSIERKISDNLLELINQHMRDYLVERFSTQAFEEILYLYRILLSVQGITSNVLKCFLFYLLCFQSYIKVC